MEPYIVSEEDVLKNKTIDSKNRPVCLVRINGYQFKFYIGPDASGFIFEDADGEYIKVGNEKRRWRGILDPIPDDPRLNGISEFGFCSIKPDAFERGLDKIIQHEIKSMGLEIIGSKTVRLAESTLFRLYPYFFEPEWELVLTKYFCSAPSLFLIIKGQSITNQLLELRKRIRLNLRNPEEHPIRNLFHCSDSQIEAIREAIIFFGTDELIELVGYLRSE
jgi:nucleoside diphosphate kinase